MQFIQIFFIQFILFCALVGRLLYLQCFSSSYFTKMSMNNHMHTHLIPNERGVIKDYHGVILAENTPTYKGYIMAYDRNEFKHIIDSLEKIIPIQEIPLYKRRSYILLYPTLTWEQVALLETSGINGLKIESTYKRSYCFNENFASVLGYVSPARETDEINLPGLYVGRGVGIESFYNDCLGGEPHCIKDEVDARGRFVQNLSILPGQKGVAVQTTLYAKLQSHICTYLKSRTDIKSAGIIVMDAHTGAVRALVSYPLFDPNKFVTQIGTKDWRELQNNPHKPLYNKVTQGVYSPGSLFKLVVLLTAMERKIELNNVFCKGHIDVKGARRHCWAWKKGGHGTVNMDRALAESCDIYFYELAKKLSLHDLMKTATRLGYGEKTAIDLQCENKGRLLSFFECFKEDPCNTFIGQGRILATPLQNACSMAALVNGGYKVTPYLVEGQQSQKESLSLDETHLKTLMNSMKNVVLRGTAGSCVFYTRNGDLGLAGKTATTQVCKIHQKERDQGNIQRAYHLKDHALFQGYGPVGQPQYVISVIVEHGGSGSVAAGVARDVMQFLLENYSTML